eukprot:scaffold25307_cov109-Isochrysis_galbana.AAC.11
MIGERFGLSTVMPAATHSSGSHATLFVVAASIDGCVPADPDTLAPQEKLLARTRSESWPVVPDWVARRRKALWILAPRGTAKPLNWNSTSEPAPILLYQAPDVICPVDRFSTISPAGTVTRCREPRRSGSTRSDGVRTWRAPARAERTAAGLPQMHSATEHAAGFHAGFVVYEHAHQHGGQIRSTDGVAPARAVHVHGVLPRRQHPGACNISAGRGVVSSAVSGSDPYLVACAEAGAYKADGPQTVRHE